MNKAPYTLCEARKICIEFQHLAGKSFSDEGRETIQCVAIVPFEQKSKERFIIYFFLLNDAAEALNQVQCTAHYDVLLLANTPDQRLLQENIYSWLNRNYHKESSNSDNYYSSTMSAALH